MVAAPDAHDHAAGPRRAFGKAHDDGVCEGGGASVRLSLPADRGALDADAQTDPVRSDYAPASTPGGRGAVISQVAPGSPAWEAGLEAGMVIRSVNGVELCDIIDWRWEADGTVAELTVSVDGEDDPYACVLERRLGQEWGVEFADVLFDEIRTCVNACEFCFLRMLPPGERASLYVRDDDYRLSFLQGNFVTLTNLTESDVDRIIRCHLSPMNVSLHAITPEVRRRLIGARAQRGIDVLTRLLEADIEVHGQIVVCPGINDGAELSRTLAWVEPWETFTSLALVPMGYTRFSPGPQHSFSDDPEAARAVVRLLEPYQRRARKTRGITRFQLSDEFYLAAHEEVPQAKTYDGYPQFYDGIGMLRSFIDEADDICSSRRDELDGIVRALVARGAKAHVVCGEAAFGVVSDFARSWAPDGTVVAHAIKNDYYGGNVNVTGLIVARDLLAQLPARLDGDVIVLPESMFNFAGDTLDGSCRGEVEAVLHERGAIPLVSVTCPSALVATLGAEVDAWV